MPVIITNNDALYALDIVTVAHPEILTIEPLFNVLKLALEWVRNGGD
jgi:hypothetical protein